MEILNEIEILKNLVSFDTSSEQAKNYSEISNYIKNEAEKIGLDVKIIDCKKEGFEPKDGKSRPNILLTKNVGAKKTLLILTHYDIVPAEKEGWNTDPFELTEREDKLYGRGTDDDKGPIAAVLSALSRVEKPKINLKFLIACDEEIISKYGLEYVSSNHADLIKADIAWNFDSNTEMIYLGGSGLIQGKIKVIGKGGHAGHMCPTDNPVPKLAYLITELEKYKKMREKKKSKTNAPPTCGNKKIWGRFSTTTLNGSQSLNSIPDTAEVGFDLRLLPEEKGETAKKELIEFLSKVSKKKDITFELDEIEICEGYLSIKTPLTKKFKKIAEKTVKRKLKYGGGLGAGDGTHIHKLGIPIIEFGPSDPDSICHEPNEFIRKKTLETMVRLVENILKEL
ncbi:M20/M25/M40 family metallo-hydrolase [Candidatus Micrarchaeota archaeon]|nr:M20/M25/M40 family metallo-hydrolase [Candidatus Micrarchaeota archaeon]